MNPSTCVAHQSTALGPQPEKTCHINQSLDAIDQSSDTASSSGASPVTPYDHKSFTFSDYGNRTKIGVALDTKANEPSPELNEVGLDIRSYTYQQPVEQKQHAQQPTDQPLDNGVDTPSSNQSNTPEIVTAGNSNGDSIISKMSWENNHDDDAAITTDDTIEDQDNTSLIFGADEKYDMDSIGNSSCTITCLEFPSPPSSTPSLVPKLTIQTDRPHRQETAETQQHSSNKSTASSRFKEIFDIEGTAIEWEYQVKHCQQPPVSTTKSYSSPLAPLPEKSVSSFTSPISPKNDNHPFMDRQQNRPQQSTQLEASALRNSTNGNKTIGGFITNIGRSASSSSSSITSSTRTRPDGPTRSLSSSSSTNSLRGLMRSFSTTATNYRHPTPKLTRQVTEEDGLTRAAQVVAASTTNDDDKLYLRTAETIDESFNTDTTTLDGQRRKIAQLFSTAIKKAPTRRHTTKVVNMQQQSPPPSSKKLLRRTVIYVNPEAGTDHHDFYDLMKQYQPQRPAPMPPPQPQRYRYDKTLPPVPPKTEATSPSTRSSVSSQLSSSSTSSSSGSKQQPSYLQGLELREMEDGSMEWGIIKKEGKRQSFFSMERLQCNDNDDRVNMAGLKMDDGTEEHIEQQVLALMGLEPDHLEKRSLHRPPPIPRRSPRRKPSTLLPTSSRNNNQHHNSDELPHITSESKDEDDEATSASTMNVYYAPDMTLPSILQLVSQSQQSNSSVNNVV